jgi:predicted ATPase/DNA-binding winged helix-turn-helix (wHTH) protein
MSLKKQLNFGPFRFDETNECVWEGAKSIQLRPKAYAVLKYLLERPNALVTKQQLLDGVWRDTFVTDAVLKDSIRQLRDALGDDAKAPRFIETAHRRGYRFIAEVTEPSHRSALPESIRNQSNSALLNSYPQLGKPFVSSLNVLGREDALEQMRQHLEKALSGTSQILFVTGEAGIGKTTLVEAFINQASAVNNLLIARGQCLEQYGAAEAYLPAFDSFSGLAKQYGSIVVETLRQHAPSWLAQMPAFTTPADRDTMQDEISGITRERMLREMAQAIEALTNHRALVIVLEDLHWCDYSTLDLISYLAHRRDTARLLLVGTYRPVEVIVGEHPLRGVKQELQLHNLCHEIPLEYLAEEAVGEFLTLRFPSHSFPSRLATVIHDRTEGNPLFMVNVVDYLADDNKIIEVDGTWRLEIDLNEAELEVPENIRHMIEKHIDRLTAEEQRVLEGASVVGMDCSAVAISAGLGEEVVYIEEVCDGLARRNHFLLPAYLAELPDGTITPRYHFIHALYLNVLYKRVAPTRRAQIHGRIGVCGEAVYGERVGEIAAELAVHFEQSRDLVRAVKYLQMAAENAARRSADYEALKLARHCLDLLKLLPDAAERTEQELSLRERIKESRERSSLT